MMIHLVGRDNPQPRLIDNGLVNVGRNSLALRTDTTQPPVVTYHGGMAYHPRADGALVTHLWETGISIRHHTTSYIRQDVQHVSIILDIVKPACLSLLPFAPNRIALSFMG